MIVKNEEAVVGRCLDCVKDIVDEIIIVDTGSTDKTVEIASKYTDKIHRFKWIGDFAAARNFSFSKATKEYVMWLDADDYLTEENQKKLSELKRTLAPDADTVMCMYDYSFDKEGRPAYSFNRERIMRRCDRAVWRGIVHEVVSEFGKVVYSDFTVSHGREHIANPTRNIEIYENAIKNGRELGRRDRFYYARELCSAQRWADAIESFGLFLANGGGWVEDNIRACKSIGRCHNALGNPDAALSSFFDSFAYDAPRPEICCEIGAIFMGKGRLRQAAYWYGAAIANSALLAGRPKPEFMIPDCHGYTPAIQLCVCHDRLGDYAKAYECNEIAGKFKPDDPAYLHNKEYLEKLLNK